MMPRLRTWRRGASAPSPVGRRCRVVRPMPGLGGRVPNTTAALVSSRSRRSSPPRVERLPLVRADALLGVCVGFGCWLRGALVLRGAALVGSAPCAALAQRVFFGQLAREAGWGLAVQWS